jgi:hypothetical protein
MSDFSEKKFGDVYESHAQKVTDVLKLIEQANDPNLNENQRNCAARMACLNIKTDKILLYCKLQSEFHWLTYLDIKTIKNHGNLYQVDEENKLIILKSNNIHKRKLYYYYEPLTHNWWSSNQPEKKYLCQNVEHFLNAYVNSTPPWRK